MKLKPYNQTLKEINDSKIIAIDYYYLEKLFKWFTEYCMLVEKCFGVRFTQESDRERIKINSKPRCCFKNEHELPFARSCSKLTHNLSLVTGLTCRSETRLHVF